MAALGPVAALAVATGRTRADQGLDAEIGQRVVEGGAKRWEGVATAQERWRGRVAHLAPERDLETIARFGGRLVIPEDAEWPEGFDDLGEQAPIGLWVRGEERVATPRRSVAVVGSRAATSYGLEVAGEISKGLADRGVTVVSGGAYGIDAQAHRAALASSGSALPTVAVMAGGLDRYYPSGNEELLRAVARRGLLVSEVPPGGAPTRHRFLRRNRLIAALAGVTVVVEAQARSGALSTVNHAVDLGRLIAAVPGPVYSINSVGCHRLLRNGAAVCVTDAQEVWELLAPAGEGLPEEETGRKAVHDGLSIEDVLVLDSLPLRSGASVDSIASVAGLSPGQVRAGLGRLQLLGLCTRAGEGWKRTKEGA
ncbi:DNA-processing protein DprA [Sinomonas sp. ASV322]|uniref:DNA-processing protein DprA n=1 Tax=Sinomonas sp. ASV322 TaxID=3041920 RepID=UPI0027DCC6E0|nr:DNA-processing protein DprA [Sinomonas sp. ASV322]MDQ4502273.1 DNA-processing protein DprA [Sinomonas sp. ASV322]